MTNRNPLLLAALCLGLASAEGAVCSRVACDVSGLPSECRLVGELVSSRIRERTADSAAAATLTVRFELDASLGGEAYEVTVAGTSAVVRAARFRALVAGAGRLLKSLRYSAETFETRDGRQAVAPAKSRRICFLERHFLNSFMDSSAEELCRYLDDLALDGMNAFYFQFTMPVADCAFATPQETAAFEGISRRMTDRVAALDCEFCAWGGSNQLPMDSPEAFRAAPNTNPRCPPTGFNACPAKPGALKALLARQQHEVDNLKGVRVGNFVNWPYDEGGCGCATCSPWGGNGYLRLIERFHRINTADHPAARTIVSTWFFNEEDYDGLWEYLKTHDWIDNVLIDDFGDTYPDYPLRHPIPGRAKILTFPEISMWGRVPWGGYGAIALPDRLENLFRQSESVSDGFMCYSEGYYEDINKALVLGLYVDPRTTTDRILADYAGYHFAGCDPCDFVALAKLLERNHRLSLMLRPDAERAVRLAEKIDGAMLPRLRTSWRWRIVMLRTLLDREIARTGSTSPDSARPYFDELVRIYHAERELRWVLDGKMGGWTCPKYEPPGMAKIHPAPTGDATESLARLVGDPMLVTVRLGRGDWRVKTLRLARTRLELVLTDGCRLIGEKGAKLLLDGVQGVTVRGEGRAVVQMPIEVTGSTNVVIRNLVVPDGKVRVCRSEGVRVDLPSGSSDCPLAGLPSDVKGLDKALEWAEQHGELEKIERLRELLQRAR